VVHGTYEAARSALLLAAASLALEGVIARLMRVAVTTAVEVGSISGILL
jgi:hypothetical protein